MLDPYTTEVHHCQLPSDYVKIDLVAVFGLSTSGKLISKVFVWYSYDKLDASAYTFRRIERHVIANRETTANYRLEL